jgi:hypothetical protein
LTGHELTAKIKEDVAQLKRDTGNSEKIYSNMLGEDKYQSMQQSLDRGKRFRR